MRAISAQKDRTDEAVHRFYTAIKEKPPRRLTLRDHFTFRIMQASYARLETMSPTDYQYWKEKGWLERDTVYFHDNVKANWFFDRVTRVVGWLTGWKSSFPTSSALLILSRFQLKPLVRQKLMKTK